ncbi:flagellar filament capping protein FliD [Marinobacter qingdaonensis]|uniref:Flagellar hook-associated protein 2 n=1 Tax=Marinobacter qingdaonensis TaxID=3108486 RepID=A0ABU5P084_9GAMM|nr:flagellar filament capping protein FliD [Marinobacter sp. ASW11-75]MEA1081471.1 flagellar filament capping protein FliD [Marinobacter sp. ASW11-75]
MAGISSLGIGSGVLSSDLVDQLVAAERQPTENRLNFNQQRTEALISAYGTLRGAITDLRLPMRQLSSPDNLKAFSGTSSAEGVSVSVDSKSAAPGNYSVQVDSLAQAQSLATGSFGDRDSTAVGSGSLTITVGDKVSTINIDSSNNTLQGIANAINEADVGANAGVIDTGNGFRLVMSADDTGLENAISIAVSDSDGNDTDAAGLSQFAFDGTTNNLTETVAAKDAVVQVNGITISRPTNTIENVIDGVSLEVSQEGVTSNVKVTQDLSKVADRVGAFVEKFNALQQTIKGLAGYNAETGQGGLLSGDATIRGIQSQMRQIIGRVVPGLEDASIRTLADVGITTNYETGGLDFDRAKFTEKLKANPDDVTALFAEQGRASDSQIEFIRSGVNTEPGEYSVNITQLATQGSLTGSNAGTGSVTVDADNDDLSFRIDGETSVSITLTAGTYTRTELAAEIQAQLDASSSLAASGRSLNVAFDGASGSLVFTSDSYGSESNVSLTSVDNTSASTLGLSVATGTAGQDVAGTINGQRATGEGQNLFVEGVGEAAGMEVRVAGGATGNRGSINFIQGVGERTVDLITNLVGIDGSLEARTDGLQKDLGRIEEERARLDLRIESYRERLVSQFSAADSLIAQLNSTQDYVSQQLAALAPQNNRNNN